MGDYKPPRFASRGPTVDVPEGIDWWIHRVATSRYKSSLHEIQTQLDLDDLLDMIVTLDMFDVLDDLHARPRE